MFGGVAGGVLEDFGVGPVHAGFIEELFGDGGVAAESFEHKDGFGIFEADFGDDVAPGGCGDFVAGVTAEAVDAAAAPEEEDFGHVAPEVAVGVVEFGEVFPEDAPGTGGFEGVVGGVAGKPFGVVVLEVGGPSGVVDGHV